MNSKHLSSVAELATQELHDEIGLFWAFNTEQFEEGIDKIKRNGILLEGEKLTSVGAGGYLPTKNVQRFIEDGHDIYANAALDLKRKYGRTALIEFELNNHECRYTGRWEDALDSLDIYFDEDEEKNTIVKDVFTNMTIIDGWL